MPQLVHTTLGPKDGTAVASGQATDAPFER
jgi:hypothetical protein